MSPIASLASLASRLPHRLRPVRWRPLRLTVALLGASLSALAAVSGCRSDGLEPGKVISPNELYWTLDLNHHAVTMATNATPPYDTLTLVATPRTVDGAPLPLDGLPTVKYVSRNPAQVAVSADGGLLHTGLDPSDGVYVVATLTVGNLKHLDSVFVKVVALEGPPPLLDSFSIHPPPTDSAKAGAFEVAEGTIRTSTCFALPSWSLDGICATLLPIRVLDATGAPIPEAAVAIRSSNPDAAWVDDNRINNIAVHHTGIIFLGDRLPPSEVKFYASTTVFGITKADTLPFRIGWPVLASLFISGQTNINYNYPVLKVGTGAIVAWALQDEDYSPDIEINFADPTNVAKVGQPAPSFMPPFYAFFLCQGLALCEDAGNVVLTGPAFRRFPVPGTYDYSIPALGISGRIIVVDER